MNKNLRKHIVHLQANVRDALIKLDLLASDAILFLVDNKNHLIGSLTDGDIRRGLIKGLSLETPLKEFVQPKPSFIFEDEDVLEKLEFYKSKFFKVVPVLDRNNHIVDIINFKNRTTLLPLDVVIMAGGKGVRLRPLTENTPKPLLKIGEKPIIEHNIDRLSKVGIKNIYISVNYLSEQIEKYFGDGVTKNLNINYIREDKPLGTVGSVTLIDEFKHHEILIMNSDILTNIDFADFYRSFKNSGADMAVAATSYQVNVPYAVLETDDKHKVLSLKEKPKYTYYSNAGIYLLKTSILSMIPSGEFFDITDLMDKILEMDRKIYTYPLNAYWLDIGKHEDFKKAQDDIKHIKL
ncbi:MAG: nucleotidyltransferase [Crocinitomicaceae bacterium]|nr:nucleotidyltransferase [Crocinitomicaceae bacterium]|tara:strand:- start:8843 stop:9895 length:1053 start_codon:yes stop_codon:yes gene_type:complete